MHILLPVLKGVCNAVVYGSGIKTNCMHIVISIESKILLLATWSFILAFHKDLGEVDVLLRRKCNVISVMAWNTMYALA